MLLIMENKIPYKSYIFINTVSWELSFHARLQFPFPTDRFCSILCIESPWLVGALGDRERLAGLGLMDGFLGTGGLHLGSLKKKKPHSLICFQYKWKIQTDGFALGFIFSFFFFLLFLSLLWDIFYFLWNVPR